MEEEQSLEFEYDAAQRPIPASQAFSVSAETISKLGEVAYRCLSNEREFYKKLEEKIEMKRKTKAAEKELEKSEKVEEGGERDETPRDKFRYMQARMTNGSVSPIIDPGESSDSERSHKKRKKKDKKRSRSRSKKEKTADEVLGSMNDIMRQKVLAKKRELEMQMNRR